MNSSDTVVISGISGNFPESNGVYEFRDNLFNKVDMVTEDDRRWCHFDPEIPRRSGKINGLNDFDPGFFGMANRTVDFMDPSYRIALEKTYEAIVDSGHNPHDFEGENCGVFVTTSAIQGEFLAVKETPKNVEALLRSTKMMAANHIAYHFKLQGSAFISDAACSSSLYCLDLAYKHIKQGICDKAIICGMHLSLHPKLTLQYARLGVLSLDGSCKAFDEAANGFVRTEGIVVIILEKVSQAKRVYAEVVHTKTNCDGYKDKGITYPSSEMQTVLMKEFYEECQVDPTTVAFVEAHGTGTKAGDPQEIETIDNIFCTNRNRPLYVGAIKTNAGHAEHVSGLLSIVKILIGFESGFIPPNLHYSTPMKNIEPLEKGRLKVVTEKIPWPEDDIFVGINNFGFGGTNGHVLFHWNIKDKKSKQQYDLPKLICASGRSEEAVAMILEGALSNGMDEEFFKLIRQVYRKPILNNPYHGYMIFQNGLEVEKHITRKLIPDKKLCIVFNKNSYEVHEALKTNPKFASKFIDIQRIMKQLSPNQNGLTKFAFHLVFADILKNLNISGNIKAVGLNNHLQTVADYFNGSLTLTETISAISTTKSTDFKVIENKFNTVFAIVGDDLQMKNKFHLTTSKSDHLLSHFLKSLGKLYLEGFCMEVDQLYPEVPYPVCRGTPMISPLIQWNHRRFFKAFKFDAHTERKDVKISVKESKWSFIKGHVIDGRNLFPGTGYLVLAWEALCTSLKKIPFEVGVVFEDVKFLRVANIPSEGELILKVIVSRGNRSFSILEGDTVLVTGKISCLDSEENTQNVHLLKEEIFMDQKDVYKELKLRGYNYRNEFKAIRRCGIKGTIATIDWNNNWTTFLDNLLQLFILQQDSKDLHVPTSIQKVVINVDEHKRIFGLRGGELTVNFYKETNIVSGGGTQITGLVTSPIARRKPPQPLLEAHNFVPYHGKLRRDHAVRCLVQTVLENTNTIKVKSVEVVDGNTEDELIMPLVHQTLEDQLSIQADLMILTENDSLDIPGIKVENKSIKEEFGCHILIVADVLQNPEFLSIALKVTRKVSGFIITKESIPPSVERNSQVQILSSYETEKGIFVLFKEFSEYNKRIPLDVSSIDDLSWLERLKVSMGEKAVLYSENSPDNGILGLANCLRKESSPCNFTAMFVMGDAPKFDIEDPFYKSQLEKNLFMNVFKEGKWGSYRHLLLPNVETVEREHFYVNVISKGDLSSLQWMEGPLSMENIPNSEMELVHVHYSAVNFKDVMLASGRISADISQDKILLERGRGLEFSGTLAREPSKRMMGVLLNGALSTMVMADPKLLWPFPDDWSLEDAATVPIVYCTVLYAFIARGRMKRGQSVLIHSGAGGVGQAAINIASHMGCTIFTTVGTQEKRQFLKKNFPQINEDHIGDSRSTSFEQMVLKQTGGRGVDFVLNSLAEEKLHASVRCLARNGVFLEIGKFDMDSDNQLAIALLAKQARFEGIMIDVLKIGSDEKKDLLTKLIREGIANGSVKPLIRTVFSREKIEEAFRFMATGTHMGKVVVRVRETQDNVHPKLFNGIPRFSCNHMGCYILIGGLGGIGMELADWLVIRGTKNLVLTSRSGVKNGYQARRLNIFKSYGVKIFIRNDNVATEDGCRSLLTFAESLGPVEGIFNLAAVLKDALIENQTVEHFKTSLIPKAYATQYLDTVSREICPRLKYFVVFSSISCGRGNPGQTNYGMANSVMERVCERRKMDGYPALAIQWGSIGDVGLVADMQKDDKELFVLGTLNQRISCCLQVLEKFLNQKQTIVSSMVVAEKKKSGSDADNIFNTVLNIIGITNLKTVSYHTTFSELGMDSIMAIEMRQTLEREYDVSLTPQETRNMTLAGLKRFVVSNNKTNELQSNADAQNNRIPEEVPLIFSQFNSDLNSDKSVVYLKELSHNKERVFAFPGIEGMASIFNPLAEKFDFNLTGFQFCPNNYLDNTESIANLFIRDVESVPGEFNIIAYSFGCAVATDLMYLLESRGKVGKAFFIDGSPRMDTQLIKTYISYKDDKMLDTLVLNAIMAMFMPFEAALKHEVNIEQHVTLDDKIKYVYGILPNIEYPEEHFTNVCKVILARFTAMCNYKPHAGKLRSKIFLAKPTKQSILNIREDYELSDITIEPVTVKLFEGNHHTIMSNDQLPKDINRFFLRK